MTNQVTQSTPSRQQRGVQTLSLFQFFSGKLLIPASSLCPDPKRPLQDRLWFGDSFQSFIVRRIGNGDLAFEHHSRSWKKVGMRDRPNGRTNGVRWWFSSIFILERKESLYRITILSLKESLRRQHPHSRLSRHPFRTRMEICADVQWTAFFKKLEERCGRRMVLTRFEFLKGGSGGREFTRRRKLPGESAIEKRRRNRIVTSDLYIKAAAAFLLTLNIPPLAVESVK